MYQVLVGYFKSYGKKVRKPTGEMDRWTDGQTESKPAVPSGETGRGLIRWCISVMYKTASIMLNFWNFF